MKQKLQELITKCEKELKWKLSLNKWKQYNTIHEGAAGQLKIVIRDLTAANKSR